MIPSRRRGDEVGESEATNTKGAPTALVLCLQGAKIRPLEEDLVFITLHPYQKDKNFLKNLVTSKVSDKVRRHMTRFVMVRERNLVEGHYHFHVIGFLPKDKNLTLKGFKIWNARLVRGHRPDYNNTLYLEDFARELALDESLNSDSSPFKNESRVASLSIELKARQQAEMRKYFGQLKYEIKDQIKFVLNYMWKENPITLYQDHTIVGFE